MAFAFALMVTDDGAVAVAPLDLACANMAACKTAATEYANTR
ncbi:hypothetical protein [Bradyrhizobium manausense]|nr:hypothetical protein [Bradyrhizobium manausense]